MRGSSVSWTVLEEGRGVREEKSGKCGDMEAKESFKRERMGNKTVRIFKT